MSQSVSNLREQTHTTQECGSWSYGITDVSIPEVNILSSTLAVSVPINLSIKLRFVSVNGSWEIDFVDALRILTDNENLIV